VVAWRAASQPIVAVVVVVAEQAVVVAGAQVCRFQSVVVAQCLAEMNNEWWRLDLQVAHQRQVESHLRDRN